MTSPVKTTREEKVNRESNEKTETRAASENIQVALDNFDRALSDLDPHQPIAFGAFLEEVTKKPAGVIRNIFQIFHDMVKSYVGEGFDEYPDDPESISFVCYDCSKLFIEGADHPFFADRLFANRLVELVEAMKRGAQQNKIYIFKGPHGCGKSTFLNNLLMKFEEYNNTEEGLRYETVWRLYPKMLGELSENQGYPLIDSLLPLQENFSREQIELLKMQNTNLN